MVSDKSDCITFTGSMLQDDSENYEVDKIDNAYVNGWLQYSAKRQTSVSKTTSAL